MSEKKSKKAAKAGGIKPVCENRKARFDYQLGERFEAGLVLTGSEVKSLRSGKMSLSDSYADVHDGEAYLVQANIEPYEKGGYANHEPKRRRKLLLHKQEIEKLAIRVQTKGETLVPLRVYFKDSRAKVELALGTGKKSHDKRQAIKERETGRELDRSMRRFKR